MDFPQYRKLSNDKVYYKFTDERNFEEIQIVGSRAFLYQHVAEKYPELLRVKDMLEFQFEGVEETSKAKYNELKAFYLLA